MQGDIIFDHKTNSSKIIWQKQTRLTKFEKKKEMCLEFTHENEFTSPFGLCLGF